MLAERIISRAVDTCAQRFLHIDPAQDAVLPSPDPKQAYLLYAHVPFCERLCPFCSFSRYPYNEDRAHRYFANLRRELVKLHDAGFAFQELYIGGGTPTIDIQELCATIDLARELFAIKNISVETNPNHLIPEYLDMFEGRVQRLSVGVQSFDDGLLHQMRRYSTYGSGSEIFERVSKAATRFDSLNVDMIFNFPGQSEEMLREDIQKIIACGCGQASFYPLMSSPSVKSQLDRTVGSVSYRREQRFYEIVCEELVGIKPDGTMCANAPFSFGNVWSFNRIGDTSHNLVDEYVVNYEQYPAIGSSGITYLNDQLLVNTFSVDEYNKAVESGVSPVAGSIHFSRKARMYYRFMMGLFGMNLDKASFERDFGESLAHALHAEMLFLRLNGAFASEDERTVTLTPRGRYLVVAMMREFFVNVNDIRDAMRAQLPASEQHILNKAIETATA